MLLASLLTTLALAAPPTMASCQTGDGPTAASCAPNGTPACGLSGDTLLCDMEDICESGGEFFAVNFRDAESVSVFGSCEINALLTPFCCIVDDPDGELVLLHLYGTKFNDKVRFRHAPSGLQLAPTGSKLDAEARGKDGIDDVQGSNSILTYYAETLRGDEGDDTIDGGDGGDALHGGDGEDVMSGGGGADTLYGDAGPDGLDGGTGNDRIWGHGGTDEIYGGDGADQIWGGDQLDWIYGDANNDTIYGGNGDDQIWGGANADTIFGQEGVDTVRGGSGVDKIHGGGGDDVLYGESGGDTLYGGLGADTLYGGDQDDFLCDTPGYGYEVCVPAQTFDCGADDDHAFMDDSTNFGFMWCPNMDLEGQDCELVSEDGRDWTLPLLAGGTEDDTPIPATCTALITAGGQ